MLRYIAMVVAGVAGAGAVASAMADRAAKPVAPNVVTIRAKDYAFEAPDTVPAGVTTLRLLNQGKELHHLWVVKLEAGKTVQDVLAAMAQPGFPTWARALGGPNAPAPGGESNATLALAPGNYVILCVIPGADGVPHVMKGMVRPLVVAPADSRAAAPKPDVSMTLDDYSFAIDKPLTAGRRVINVRNVAAQAHEVELIRLAPGVSVEQALAWIEKPVGAPLAMPIGGVNGLGKGAEASFAADLTPGDYALVCFFPDAKDGKPHFMHGMTRKITVS